MEGENTLASAFRRVTPLGNLNSLNGTLCQNEVMGLAAVIWLKPGGQMAALNQKVNVLVKQSFAQTKTFSSGEGKTLLAKVYVLLTLGGVCIEDLRETYAANLWTLVTVSGLVLLIACANVANLLLVRGMVRKAEISLRTAPAPHAGKSFDNC